MVKLGWLLGATSVWLATYLHPSLKLSVPYVACMTSKFNNLGLTRSSTYLNNVNLCDDHNQCVHFPCSLGLLHAQCCSGPELQAGDGLPVAPLHHLHTYLRQQDPSLS